MQLVARLGYDKRGRHAGGRRLVFVGDLGDRGPDSPGVFEFVMKAADAGGAVSVLGNHELPLIDSDRNEQPKPGNAWFFGDDDACLKDESEFGPFKRTSEEQRKRIRTFCDSMPIAIEHPQVRVVHACWDRNSLDFIGSVDGASNHEIIAACRARTTELLARAGLEDRFGEAKIALRSKRQSRAWKPVTNQEQEWIKDLQAGEKIEQNENPVKVVTSGIEWPAEKPAFLGGKWRFMRRVAWWQKRPLEWPTVFGHYWRQREQIPTGPYDEHSVLFGALQPDEWLGPERFGDVHRLPAPVELARVRPRRIPPGS